MRTLPAFALAALSAFGLAACGGSSSSSNSSSASAQPTPTVASTPAPSVAGQGQAGGGLVLAADPTGQLRYDHTSLNAKAGKVAINFSNHSSLGHNLTIAQGSKVIAATPTFQGGAKTVTATLKPGTYTFYCSVPGHRMAGMQGTLTVT